MRSRRTAHVSDRFHHLSRRARPLRRPWLTPDTIPQAPISTVPAAQPGEGAGGRVASRPAARCLDRLSGSEPRREVRRRTDSDRVAPCRPAVALEAADRPWVRLVRRGGRPRVHDRTAAASRRSWPRTTSKRDASSGRTAGTGSSWRPWAATARARRPRITTGAFTRSARSGELRCLDARTGARLAARHPGREPRREPALGHVGVAAHRGRQGHRAAGRDQADDRWSPTTSRRATPIWHVAGRSAGLHVADARDARRRTADC